MPPQYELVFHELSGSVITLFAARNVNLEFIDAHKSFKKAIETKPPIISDYKVITFDITQPEIDEIYKSNKFVQIKKKLLTESDREMIIFR